MTAAVAIPLWALVLLVAATPFTGWLGARQGARQAIALCSAHWGCAMVAEKKRIDDTQNLRKELDEMHAKAPDLFDRLNRAMRKALKDSDPNLAAIPERPRAKKDEDGQR
jgi:hypothetical protein